MKTVTADDLRTLVADIFRSRNVSPRDSEITSSSLVYANLRGVDSHGVIRTPHYVKRIEAGSINPAPKQTTERTSPSTAMLDGDHGLGHPAVWDAMNLAIEIAREAGVGFVGVNHSSHCGALSFFAMQAVNAGMIGLVFSQTDKGVVPFGGREPFFGTNPLCVGIPSKSGPPIVLDMATSTVAGGHVFKARAENRPIPPTWALDKDGNPTTDPHKGIYWTPAAGAKGYGLGAVVDVLTGVLCGGAFGPHVVPMYESLEKQRNLCHLAAVIDYRRFAGSSTFLDVIKTMISEIHQVPPAEGFDRVLVPGEPEYLREQDRSANGIPLEDYVWNDLTLLEN